MIFREELARAIIKGEKTATRRQMSDNPRSPWWRGGCRYKGGQVFSVNPGRGLNRVADARVTRVYAQQLGQMWPGDARREGFPTLAEFREAFGGINGAYDPAEVVWVVEFEVVGVPAMPEEIAA